MPLHFNPLLYQNKYKDYTAYMESLSSFLLESDLEKQILNLLAEDPVNEEIILTKITSLTKNQGDSVYARVLKILSHLECNEQEAVDTWNKIIENRNHMCQQLGREVSFRVAMLDYFVSVNKKIKNPKVIEIKLYVETEKLILIDHLTGVYNRRYFLQALEREINQARRYKRKFSLMMLDIDDFKKINDNFGHSMGDYVLQKIGEILNKNLRNEDTACRFGGEEFILILPEIDQTQCKIAGDKIREKFSEVEINGIHLSLSGGIATFDEDADNERDLLEVADKNLYYAKYTGKNRIVSNKDEARNDFRYNMSWDLEYIHHGQKKSTLTKNISLHGVCFNITGEVSIGDYLEIGLRNPDSSTMEVKVLVRWIKKISENDQYLVGASFENFIAGDPGKLKNLLTEK